MRNNLPKYYNRGNDPLHARTRQQQKRDLLNHPGDRSGDNAFGYLQNAAPQQGPDMFNPLAATEYRPLGQNLEQNQALHNTYISAAKNVSGSNDVQQQRHDMNETLIRGAELLDAGRSAGLNDDQTLQVAMRQLGLQQSRDANLPQRELIQRARTNVADDSILKEIGKRQGR